LLPGQSADHKTASFPQTKWSRIDFGMSGSFRGRAEFSIRPVAFSFPLNRTSDWSHL
jgi:inner membrane protein involved in colicin E2 resistance